MIAPVTALFLFLQVNLPGWRGYGCSHRGPKGAGATFRGQKGLMDTAALSFHMGIANLRAGVGSSHSWDTFWLPAKTCQLVTCLEKV